MLSPHSTCLDAFYASEPTSHAAATVAKIGTATPALKPVGCWPLAPNHALSLRPVQTSVLHIAQGRVWVTVGEGVQPRDAGYGDCFLEAGQQLEVLAGQRVVFESMDKVNPVYFNFSASNMPIVGVNTDLVATYLGVNEAQLLGGVVQPWSDLRLALGLASSALVRFTLGLTWGSVLRLGRLGIDLKKQLTDFLLRYSH
ncbi:MAG: DUF2917 domain-containing protein [Burkholderiaceae bacterium]|nr:DUF2917 domain-containing protein [Burkholderiaceae bacterium]